MRRAFLLGVAALVIPVLPVAGMTVQESIEILHGKDVLRMEDAIESLVAAGSQAVPELIALLAPETARDARACSIEALGRIGDSAALEPLLAVLRELGPVGTETDAFAARYVRTETLVALGGLGDVKAQAPLEQAAAGPDPFDRVHALTALARLEITGALERLESHLGGEHAPEIRALAVRGLFLLGDPAGVRPLVRALKDPKWYVRDAAADYLGRLGDPRAREELERLLEADDSPFVRRTAREALSHL